MCVGWAVNTRICVDYLKTLAEASAINDILGSCAEKDELRRRYYLIIHPRTTFNGGVRGEMLQLRSWERLDK